MRWIAVVLLLGSSCSSVENLGRHQIALPAADEELSVDRIFKGKDLSKGDYLVEWTVRNSDIEPNEVTLRYVVVTDDADQQHETVIPLEPGEQKSGKDGYPDADWYGRSLEVNISATAPMTVVLDVTLGQYEG